MCFNKSLENFYFYVNPKSIWRTPTFSHLFTFWGFFIFSTSFIFHIFSTQKKWCHEEKLPIHLPEESFGPFHFEAPRPIRGISHRWPFPQTCASSWENMESQSVGREDFCLMEFCRKKSLLWEVEFLLQFHLFGAETQPMSTFSSFSVLVRITCLSWFTKLETF